MQATTWVGFRVRDFLPTGVDDLIELAALQAAIQTGDMDRLDFPQNCLDVVAQFIIGLVIINELDIDEAYEIIVNSWSVGISSTTISSKSWTCWRKSEGFGSTGRRTSSESVDILE